MNSLISKINYALERLLMLMMLAIVVTVSWQVFSRFILQSPSSFTEELSRYLLIWIGILGAAYAYKTKAHLGLDLFVEKLPTHIKTYARLLIEVLVIIFATCVMIYGGVNLVALTLELKQTSAALGLQMGWVYSVIPLSGVLITLYAVTNLHSIINDKESK
ncbi:TRAP transporter small permease [Psychrosphaera sp. B3R10]|uniref:TRAP transporter small permease protein n=1 Tax=Psychrosphaera algicola TaxID=3023714 RepID=A0ABT5FIG7_9GAMM|nr:MULTISPECIES: TRAP transporter small permease [unclassified Psychrosphaera]MBU2881684.1 TRAP transporter small permease [Psychrosphaera sp. I2R16]MBU2991061.1 TRAP transporter small permease [Psychrosphaera sp. B3R10]MDC2890965.1 TRAP transporter small permease [Psychrosphaera sp. G1-22]MDO6718772.1 TRAP transporter small permease [Psychrosphaera sp. 1_MG-2023]